MMANPLMTPAAMPRCVGFGQATRPRSAYTYHSTGNRSSQALLSTYSDFPSSVSGKNTIALSAPIVGAGIKSARLAAARKVSRFIALRPAT